MSAVDRVWQIALIVSMLCLSWLGMMAVHELGHVLHAWASGGTVWRVILHPLAISVTYYRHNPHPHFVAWGGALWGSLLPLGLLGLVQFARRRLACLFRFFAAFCLLANGVYIGLDAFVQAGDGRTLVRGGSPRWLLVAFGCAAVGASALLWNGLGPSFGLGTPSKPVGRRAVVGVVVALVALIGAELLLFPGR